MAELSGKDAQSCPSTFVGNTELIARPAPNGTEAVVFRQNEKINIWMQAYNLRLDSQTHKPQATIEYNIFDIVSGKQAFHSIESAEQLAPTGEQITLKKTLPPRNLSIGKYNLKITVNDKIAKQTISTSNTLAVE